MSTRKRRSFIERHGGAAKLVQRRTGGMGVNDLVEDRAGDKAVVREVYDDGYVQIEWDCRPGVLARVHESRLSNISDRVRDLDSGAA